MRLLLGTYPRAVTAHRPSRASRRGRSRFVGGARPMPLRATLTRRRVGCLQGNDEVLVPIVEDHALERADEPVLPDLVGPGGAGEGPVGGGRRGALHRRGAGGRPALRRRRGAAGGALQPGRAGGARRPARGRAGGRVRAGRAGAEPARVRPDARPGARRQGDLVADDAARALRTAEDGAGPYQAVPHHMPSSTHIAIRGSRRRFGSLSTPRPALGAQWRHSPDAEGSPCTPRTSPMAVDWTSGRWTVP